MLFIENNYGILFHIEKALNDKYYLPFFCARDNINNINLILFKLSGINIRLSYQGFRHLFPSITNYLSWWLRTPLLIYSHRQRQPSEPLQTHPCSAIAKRMIERNWREIKETLFQIKFQISIEDRGPFQISLFRNPFQLL